MDPGAAHESSGRDIRPSSLTSIAYAEVYMHTDAGCPALCGTDNPDGTNETQA